jgi:hypothetical protein
MCICIKKEGRRGGKKEERKGGREGGWKGQREEVQSLCAYMTQVEAISFPNLPS